MTRELNKARKEVVEYLKKSLSDGIVPWNSPYLSPVSFYNATNNHAYKGVNRFILWVASLESNYQDPRWCTFIQAKNNNWKIKSTAKGKGIKVEFWNIYDTFEKKNITPREYQTIVSTTKNAKALERYRFYSKVYTVFNAEHIDGIPALEISKNNPTNEQLDIFINRYKDSTNLSIEYNSDAKIAYYDSKHDKIVTPPINKYKESDHYYATLFHECSHSTGHASRLSRKIVYKFGTEEYAKEELRAEISAAFLCGKLGINSVYQDPSNSIAYIQYWLSILENKEGEFFKAVNDANKIADYILEKGNYKELEILSLEKKEELEYEYEL